MDLRLDGLRRLRLAKLYVVGDDFEHYLGVVEECVVLVNTDALALRFELRAVLPLNDHDVLYVVVHCPARDVPSRKVDTLADVLSDRPVSYLWLKFLQVSHVTVNEGENIFRFDCSRRGIVACIEVQVGNRVKALHSAATFESSRLRSNRPSVRDLIGNDPPILLVKRLVRLDRVVLGDDFKFDNSFQLLTS